MIFEQIPVNGDRNLSYLIGDDSSRRAAIVDAAYRARACIGKGPADRA